tara:strand:- start:24776 stop:26914 length:2139 start_codon:yes stop_codon:yes gene_type:complete
MAGFWEKQVKKYQRGKGIKHKTDNAKRAPQRSGGMSERQIQLKLELLIDPSLSSNKNIFDTCKILKTYSLSDQERFLNAIEKLSSINQELAYNFCDYGVKAIKKMDDYQWNTWLKYLNKVYKEKDLNASIIEIKEYDNFLSRFSSESTGINFSEISKLMESMVTGLNGRSLKIQSSNDSYTDTESIFLPENISSYNNKSDNFDVIKLSTFYSWAQTWYGTWRLKKIDIDNTNIKIDDFFKKYQFMETIRLDSKIKKDYPGIGKLIDKFNPIYSTTDPRIKEIISLLSNTDSTYKDSLKYIDKISTEEIDDFKIPYTGKYKGSEVFKKIDERLDINKSFLKNNLTKLKDDEGTDQDKNFKITQNPDDEYDLKLEIDNKEIEIPDELKDVLESIVQDTGEISDDLLVTEKKNSNDLEKTENEKIASQFLYDEWDYSRKNYHKKWCKLDEINVDETENNFVADTLFKYKGLVKHLNKTFEALRQDDKRQRMQKYGDDIDLDSFIDAFVDMKRGSEIDEKLFIKLNKTERNVAVMFMVDMSGSTTGWVNQMEKESLVLLCQSLEILGDMYGIYGFSGRTRNNCEIYKIKAFEESYNSSVKNRISNISPMNYTRMGASIRHLSMLLNQIQAKTKILITLSDGKPDDVDGYKGTYGIEDTKKALLEARYFGIHTFCITIDKEGMEYLPHMYGRNNFTVIDEIDKLPSKVSDIYRKITR